MPLLVKIEKIKKNTKKSMSTKKKHQALAYQRLEYDGWSKAEEKIIKQDEDDEKDADIFRQIYYDCCLSYGMPEEDAEIWTYARYPWPFKNLDGIIFHDTPERWAEFDYESYKNYFKFLTGN